MKINKQRIFNPQFLVDFQSGENEEFNFSLPMGSKYSTTWKSIYTY